MDIYEAMLERHSVRQYIDKKIPNDVIYAMQAECEAINEESDMHVQIVVGDDKAFNRFFLKRLGFKGVQNYLVLVGPKGPDFDEKSGYYGERLVLKAQMLGLNTCWVGVKVKAQCNIAEGEKQGCVIAFGYGENNGKERELRDINELCEHSSYMPKWFEQGMLAVALAPSAMNQQHYKFILKADDTVEAVNLGGPFSGVDLGIAEYHFELGAKDSNFTWAE